MDRLKLPALNRGDRLFIFKQRLEYNFFMELQVGVKAFLKNKDGKYLILKRSRKFYPTVAGLWDVIGGRITPGTSLLENLKREIREEVKLELKEEPQLIDATD